MTLNSSKVGLISVVLLIIYTNFQNFGPFCNKIVDKKFNSGTRELDFLEQVVFS